jgi:hypothetical protein
VEFDLIAFWNCNLKIAIAIIRFWNFSQELLLHEFQLGIAIFFLELHQLE